MFEDKLTVADGYPIKSDDNSEPYEVPADELATINRWLESGLANLPAGVDPQLWQADYLVLVYGKGEHPSVAAAKALQKQVHFSTFEQEKYYENLLTPTNL